LGWIADPDTLAEFCPAVYAIVRWNAEALPSAHQAEELGAVDLILRKDSIEILDP